MKKTRRIFDKEFKLMIVQLCEAGKTTKEVSKEFEVPEVTVNRWKREHKEFGKNSFAGNGNAVMTDEQAEIARLRKELREAELERDILKKAISIFSRTGGKSTSL